MHDTPSYPVGTNTSAFFPGVNIRTLTLCTSSIVEFHEWIVVFPVPPLLPKKERERKKRKKLGTELSTGIILCHIAK